MRGDLNSDRNGMGGLAFSGWARGDVLTTALDLRVWVNGLVHATAGARQAYTHPTPVPPIKYLDKRGFI